MKSCDNCYFRGYKDMFCINKTEKPKESICDGHSYICVKCDDIAGFEYKDKQYCEDCLLKEFEVESYTITHYTMNGEYLGCDDNMCEVISNISKDIKELD